MHATSQSTLQMYCPLPVFTDDENSRQPCSVSAEQCPEPQDMPVGTTCLLKALLLLSHFLTRVACCYAAAQAMVALFFLTLERASTSA
jgi:hypothetical protein